MKMVCGVSLAMAGVVVIAILIERRGGGVEEQERCGKLKGISLIILDCLFLMTISNLRISSKMFAKKQSVTTVTNRF